VRALILVAGAALALSGCTTLKGMSTEQKIDAACETSVLIAQATGTVAQIAVNHGADPVTAQKLADKAARGENIVATICTVGHIIAPEL
jgi:hypothetical protein